MHVGNAHIVLNYIIRYPADNLKDYLVFFLHYIVSFDSAFYLWATIRRMLP